MFSLRDLRFVLCSRDLDVLRAQRIMGFLSWLPTNQRGRKSDHVRLICTYRDHAHSILHEPPTQLFSPSIGLEKTPLVVPQQYHLHQESENSNLSPEAEVTLERVMHRLADRVRIRRIQIFPLFEDYDRVHNGTVSRSQFHRALSEMELGSLVSAREFEVLYKRFNVVVGLKNDFNYIAFCDMVNDYAKFEYGKPWEKCVRKLLWADCFWSGIGGLNIVKYCLDTSVFIAVSLFLQNPLDFS